MTMSRGTALAMAVSSKRTAAESQKVTRYSRSRGLCGKVEHDMHIFGRAATAW
jgi:hypothetical protein